MKKYLCLLCLSTKNHNILCFLNISGINLLNKGICLWKAPKPLAGRGFPIVKICPKFGATSGECGNTTPKPSLVLAGAGDKAQKRCNLGEIGADVDNPALGQPSNQFSRDLIRVIRDSAIDGVVVQGIRVNFAFAFVGPECAALPTSNNDLVVYPNVFAA